MTIVHRHADLFTSRVVALVNPVNCVGVMGRGLALSFARQYPEILRPYKAACHSGDLRPGRVMIHRLAHRLSCDPVYIIHFPTKRHWRDPSRIDDIQNGLHDLAARCDGGAISSIAVPPLGCGLGGLPWPAVRTLIQQSFQFSTFTRCYLHTPAPAFPR